MQIQSTQVPSSEQAHLWNKKAYAQLLQNGSTASRTRLHHAVELLARKTDFAFVWLLNPVLLITIARK